MKAEAYPTRLCRPPALSWLLGIAMMLFTSPTTRGIVLPTDDGSVPCEMAIEFLVPHDWRCTNDDHSGCIECRNVTDHSTELVMHCVGRTITEKRSVPPGTEMSICHGEKKLDPSQI